MGRSSVTNCPGLKSNFSRSGIWIQKRLVASVAFSILITLPGRHGSGIGKNFAQYTNANLHGNNLKYYFEPGCKSLGIVSCVALLYFLEIYSTINLWLLFIQKQFLNVSNQLKNVLMLLLDVPIQLQDVLMLFLNVVMLFLDVLKQLRNVLMLLLDVLK